MAIDIPDIRRPPSENFNLATHAAGALLAVAGLAHLVLRAEGPLATTAFAIYGGSLIALFTSSTLHHAVPHNPHNRQVLRRLDHIAIYLLIMGTYTPVCLLAGRDSWGIPLLVVVWAFGLVGIALKIFRPFTNRWVTIGSYVGMGWAAVAAVVPAARTFPPAAMSLLVGGGLVYTVGAVVYATQKPNLFPKYVGFHGVWHVFVLVAAALHYAFIALFVPAA